MANYDLTYEGSRVQNILDTGDELRDAGYIFRGEATPSTVPGTPTERVAYIGGPGTYTNFGSSTVVPSGSIGVFKYTGSAWSNEVIACTVPISTTVQNNDTTVPTGKAVKTVTDAISGAVSSEASARQLGDSTLQGGINTVSAAITAINNAIGNGCVYAGIATPSSTPASGKVFYLAFTAGTYTNFNSLEVPQGINILKNNGSTWLLDSFLGIDDAPTQGSANLVKSGGVLNSIIQNGPAFDLSAYNAQGGVLATYADLSAALTALNALPADFKKGGMSMKYVQTSDNKYVQWRLKSQSFSVNPEDWTCMDGSTYIDNPEFIDVVLDKEGKLLESHKNDGTKVFYGDVEVKGRTAFDEDIEISGVKTKGKDMFEIPSISIGGTQEKTIDDPEGRIEVSLDSERKILSYRDNKGVLHEEAGIETPQVNTSSLNLTDKGLGDFVQAIKDAGYSLNGYGYDWSDRDNIELPEPKHYSLLNIIVDTLPVNDNDVSEGRVQYYDGLGNYFNIECSLTAQGQTSRAFARAGGKGNYTLDLPKDIKFGSWVPQDSFHLKGCAKDVVRGILPTSYKWAYMFQKALDAQPDRVLVDESDITFNHASGTRINDWPRDARCMPDGFPVEVYINGEYWGLYSWQLKKHRKNYSMDKKDYTSFFIDADAILTADYQHGIWNDGVDATIPGTSSTWWTGFDIKGPKDLYCMDGSKFDGDHPKELIDSTSPYYDSSNKAHKGSQTTKTLIRAFQTKYLEVKTLIDNNSIEEAKTKFNENFDYNSCMLVYIFNCLMKNVDSVMKNTLWGMYKSGKIFASLWDLDGMYGEGWMGEYAKSPSPELWEGAYTTAKWPLSLFWALYETEIKTAYATLRQSKIIDINTWHDIVFNQWVNRIGEEAYNRDIKRWPETPSYRENYTNTDYWIEIGATGSIGSDSLWNSTTQYHTGDYVLLSLHELSGIYMKYQCKVDNIDICPVTEFYEGFPQEGGFYDSPFRWEKWMIEQIRLCDITLGYSE